MKLDCCPGYQALGADRWGAEVLPVIAQRQGGMCDGIWWPLWWYLDAEMDAASPAHSSVVALRLCLHQGHTETAWNKHAVLLVTLAKHWFSSMEIAGAVLHVPSFGPWCPGSYPALGRYMTFWMVLKKEVKCGNEMGIFKGSMGFCSLAFPWGFLMLQPRQRGSSPACWSVASPG